MIEYRRGDKVLALLWPEPGRYTAVVDGDPICDVEVSAKIIAEWGRVCARGAEHLLPVAVERRDGGLALVYAANEGDWSHSQRYACAAYYSAAWEAAHNAVQAVRWAALEADDATLEDGHAAWAAAEDAQRTHLHRLIWEAHGKTLTTRARIELARDLRYRGEDEAAAAVLPAELREVAT